MRTIRKGNDINVKWYITRQGEAEDFTNKDVKVYLYDKFNNKQEFTYTINGNVVDGYFLGKDQITNGVYRLCLVENDGTTDMVTLDYIDCWLLSNKLKNKTASGYDTSSKIETEVVELTSVINTSGEVVDLTGYVTVDDLDDIMDDVYTKEQVDQKIVDVATGGDIDLGAYAKKADVYTKAEVDSAISNVETIKGDKGDKGDPFTYEDFTQAQLESLKGADGAKGDKGDPFTYEDFTQAQLAALKGEKGDKGDKGDTGTVDTTNFYTKSEVDQKILEAETEGVDLTDYALKNDVYTKSQVDTLIENVEGQVGDAGKSAYEIAVDNGFVGTEVEWLASLKGTDGDDGAKGDKGDKGDAFTYSDFTQAQLEALKGAKGDKGDKGDPFVYSDFTSEQLAALKGEKGDKGDKGDTGTVDTTNFYTKAQVDQKVAEAASGGQIDLSGYAQVSDVYTKDEIDEFGFLTSADAQDTIYSKTEIDNMGFLTEHQSLRNYYTKNDVYSKAQIDEFAFLTGADAIATIYSKTEIDNMGFLTEHQSLADYFTKNEINTIKAGYYTKDEIDSFGYITSADAADTIYTKTQIDNMGFLTTHQSLANYYTKGDVDTALTGYYTKTQVDNFGFLTSADAAETIYSKAEIDNKGFLTQHQSLANYYTKDDIDTTLEDYYTKDDIDDFGYLSAADARQTIYSKTEIDNKGFLTQHQSLANYFTKDEIQEDYYDKEVIDNKFQRVNAVPTKTSDLTNDSGFLTSTDVYTKTQTYSKTEVDNLVANSGGSGSSSGGGGFNVVTNSSDSTKKGLVNSLSTNYSTNIGKCAVIEGGGNDFGTITASGEFAHAEGYATTASDHFSHAEGMKAKANGYAAHAEGSSTTASGKASHAEGLGTIANNQSEHASGQYNVSNTASTTFGNDGNTLFSVGNGTSSSTKHNAFEIRQNGDIYIVDTNDTTYSNYYQKPMIKLQDAYYTAAQTDAAIDAAVAEIAASGGQLQVDWDSNDSSSVKCVQNKPVGKFKVRLFKEFTNVSLSKSNYNNNSYYYSSFGPTSKYIKIDGIYGYHYVYPSSPSDEYLLDENGQIVNDAPSWWDSSYAYGDKSKRYIIEVDGKRVLCNSSNENITGIRGDFSARFSIYKITCDIDSEGNKLETQKDVYYIGINFPEWLTQSPNVSSLKIYETDETSNTEMYLTWYDINHVYFYDKEEVNNFLSPSDWDNNDPSTTQYIKNKPFGEFPVNKVYDNYGEWYHPNESTYTLNDGRYYTNSKCSISTLGLHIGIIYYVYIDGELYGTIEPVKYNSNYWVTSNYDYSNGRPYLDYTGKNKLFAYGYSDYVYIGLVYDSTHIMCNNGGATWTPQVEIYEVNPNGTDTLQFQIDSNFIDYNSYITDESITDKPFGNVIEYQDNNEYTTVYTNDFLAFNQTGPNHFGSGITFSQAIAIGDKVELIIDGLSRGIAEVEWNDIYHYTVAGIGDYDSYGFKNNWMIRTSDYTPTASSSWTLCATRYSSNTTHSVVVRKVVEGEPTVIHSIKTIDSRYVDTYTKSEIDTKIANVSGGSSSGGGSSADLSNYYTKTEIDNKGYLTAHQDISGKANSADVYTKAEIDTMIGDIETLLSSI